MTHKLKSSSSDAGKTDHYRSLIDNLDRGFCVAEILFDDDRHPVDYRFLEINHLFEAQTGLINPVGKTAKELVPNLEDHWIQIYGNVAITGEPVVFTQGSEAMGRWFQVKAFRIDDSVMIGILFSDISEIRRAESALRESDQRFRVMADAAPNMIWSLKADGSYMYINKYALDYFGQSFEYAMTHGWYDNIHPDDVSGVKDDLMKAISTRQTYRKEHRIKGKSGEYRWFLAQGSPSFYPNGDLYGYVGSAIDITSLKLTQENLMLSEQRFAAAIEAIEGTIWTNTSDGMMRGTQIGWAALTGQKYEEYQGLGWANAVHPEDADTSVASWNKAVAQVVTYEHEHRLKTASGDWRIFSVKAIPVLNADGTIREWVGVHTDITSQRESAEAIKTSESRFQNLVRDSTAAIVVLIGEEMKVEIVNEAYAKLLHLEPDDLLQKRLFDVIPDAAAYYRPILDQVRATGQPVILHDSPYAVNINGEEVSGFLHVVYQPYRDNERNILGVMAILQDVTEYVKVRRQLEESESRFRSLIHEAPIATCLFVGREMRIEVANEIMLGYWGKGSAVMGKPLAEALPESVGQDFLAILDHAYSSGETYESRAHRADVMIDSQLRTFYFDFTYKPLLDAENLPYGIMQMAMDVTDQVIALQKLTDSETRFRELSEKLEEEVDIRTQQLRRSNEDLQQFAHVASHDLKEPVRKIKTFTGRLQDEVAHKLDPAAKTYLDKIEKATNRMVSMIDGVLTYSSIDATELPSERVDLNEVIGNIASDLEVLIEQKKTTINAGKLPYVDGAGVLLYQLFYNLINNSIKFSAPGAEPVIDIAGRLDDKEPKAVITISDNGIGFDQESASSIFNTFTRLHSKDKYEGTGLGLALCKKIVERHSGKITAYGEQGKGATFVVTLPLKQSGII